MSNYKITVQYDGTRYNGWQRQGNTDNTIQGKLNEIIGRYLGEEIDVAGSGRTDKGVHAKGQIASFRAEKNINARTFLKEINSYLPEDIRITDFTKVDDRFHARLSAVSKTYEYTIDNSMISDVFSRKYACRIEEKLDVEAMKKAAEYFVGTYDFISFCGNKHFKKSSVRTINAVKISSDNGKIVISFSGDGFLQNMVRLMSGTLIEVGLHKRKPESIAKIIESKDVKNAGMMAPPEGLCLKNVKYR